MRTLAPPHNQCSIWSQKRKHGDLCSILTTCKERLDMVVSLGVGKQRQEDFWGLLTIQLSQVNTLQVNVKELFTNKVESA